MSLPPLDDTGDLQQLAEAIERMKHDPRRPGGLDVMLLSIAIGAAVVVGICIMILTVASDHFHVESGRIVLTMAAAGTCVSPVLLGLWGLNRLNRRRYRESMDRVGQIIELVKSFAQARQTANIGYSCSLQTIETNLGLLAAQVEHVDAKMEKATAETAGLLDQLAAAVAAQQRAVRDRLVQDVLTAVERRAPEARKLSRSEYWEVYQDVMADLGDMPAAPEE